MNSALHHLRELILADAQALTDRQLLDLFVAQRDEVAVSWSLELTHPALLAGLLALPVLVWYFRRSLVDFPHGQRLLSLACRAVIVGLLVLALADLTLLRPAREQFVLFVIDGSRSVGPEARQAAETFIDHAL